MLVWVFRSKPIHNQISAYLIIKTLVSQAICHLARLCGRERSMCICKLFFTWSNYFILLLTRSCSFCWLLSLPFLTVDLWSRLVLTPLNLGCVLSMVCLSISSRNRCRVAFPSTVSSLISFRVSLISVRVELSIYLWPHSDGSFRNMFEIE
jgi:hypothetical protein